MKDGILSRHLFFRVDLCVIGIYHDPGCPVCKSGTGFCAPLHGGSGIVPAFVAQITHHVLRLCLSVFGVLVECIDALNIPEIIQGGEGDIGHAKFFTLIDVRRSLHHVKAGGQHLGRDLPVLVGVIAKS